MSSLHHWLVALAQGLKRDKHKRRIEEEARRDRLKLEAYREQMRAEALVEVERLGMMGGRPHEMRLGTYRRHERPKRLEAPDESHKQLAQKVALAKTPMAILREGRMVRNLAVEPQPAEME